MGFTRAELESFRDQPVDDLVAPDLRLLFVGINPGLWTAATNTHFARPGNRFYPALHLAGITARRLDPSDGLSDEDRQHLVQRGIGITNLVNRATVRADELHRDELIAGAEHLRRRLTVWRPAVVAVLGVTAYRTAFRQPGAQPGRQPQTEEGSVLFVLGNPSGLNAHETPVSLARAFREAAKEGGVRLDPPRW